MNHLRNHLHLYIGTTCQFKSAKGGGMFTRPLAGPDIEHFFDEEYYAFIKPVLRPLSDITHEEMGHIVDMSSGLIPNDYDTLRRIAAEETVYLLRRGFDLFRLIESDLAIDKTKL